MKTSRIFAILLAAAMIISMFAFAASAEKERFPDIKEHWAEDVINKWADRGIVNGYPDGNYVPDGYLTRAEAAQVFVNLLKLSTKGDISAYKDVIATEWYADPIAKCVARGIVKGVASDKMDPNGDMTREMFFTMYARALGIPEEAELKVAVSDKDAISSWAEGYINALVNNGYVKGIDVKENGAVVAPGEKITRAQIISLIDQSILVYIDEAGEYTIPEAGIVLVVANDAVITAPEGTIVIVAEGVTGTIVNGVAIPGGSIYVVSGGGTDPDPGPVNPSGNIS